MTGLLPKGFHDLLPPLADAAARFEEAVLGAAFSHGYERADPPLAEFEETLTGRLKSDGAAHAVRFVDPVSGRMLAIRPDITSQIGRIAATRMAHHPRPVRLSYAGPVLLLAGTDLRPERTRRQLGCELIGLDSVAAVREIVGVAVEALQAAGCTALTIDLTLPDLIDTLAAGRDPATVEALRDRLDAKDAGGVAEIDADFLPLIDAAGPFDQAIERLRALDADGVLTTRIDALIAIAEGIGDRATLTLDPTERHGFEYQSWFGFSIFADGAREEIGRGGTYTVVADGREEAAVGFSLYVDPVLEAGIVSTERRRLFVPLGSDPAVVARLRGEGWVTVAALEDSDSAAAQACTHQLTLDGPASL